MFAQAVLPLLVAIACSLLATNRGKTAHESVHETQQAGVSVSGLSVMALFSIKQQQAERLRLAGLGPATSVKRNSQTYAVHPDLAPCTRSR